MMTRMRKQIIVSAVLFVVLFLGMIAAAQAQPYTVWGRVFDEDGITPVDGANVTVTDINTGESLSTTTAGGGYYQVVFGPPATTYRVSIGDTLRIEASYNNKMNTTTVSATGSPQKVDIVLAGDTTPPETTITGGPSGTINYNDITFTWTGSDDITPTAQLMYSYILEGYDTSWSAWTSSTSKTYSDLPNGVYTFRVKARDLVGNEDPTPAERSFTVSVRRVPRGGGAPVTAAGETIIPATAEGEVTRTTTAAYEGAVVTIPAGIKATIGGAPITKITIKLPSVLPAAPPPNVEYKGYAYDFGPGGATFSEPVEISITFDPADFEGLTPVIYMYDETAKEWKRLDTTIVDNKAIAKVTHFTTFVLFGEKVPPSPTPTPTPILTPTPPLPGTPMPSPTPTPTPSPSPSPTPGFEAIFAVAGLLAIAYLVLWRRK